MKDRLERLSNPESAYMHDPDFCALVKMIEMHLSIADFTPSEVRKAAVLACIRFEMRRSRPLEVLLKAEHDLGPSVRLQP